MADDMQMATPDEQNYKPPAQQPPADGPAPAAGSAPGGGGGGQPPQAAPGSPAATDQQHKAVGGIYHSILSALGGADDVSYSRDDKGNLVTTKTPRTPGQQWKQIIAGALTGMAAGAAAKKANPGAPALTGAGLGFQAVANKNLEQDTRQREQADTTFKAKQSATMQQAQVAMMTQQTTASIFKLSREQIDAKYEDSERENALTKAVAGDPTNRDLGVARNMDDVLQMHKDMPDLIQQQAAGNIYGIPHVNADGKIDGMHFVLVNPDWKGRKLDHDETLYRLLPGKKPGDAPTVDRQTVKAGTMTNGDFMTAQQASSGQFTQLYEHESAQANENKRASQKEAGENARAKMKDEGETARTKMQIEGKKDVAEISGGRKAVVQHDKDYVKPAEGVEESYRMSDAAYREYKEARAQGKQLPTGAQSMLMLSQHLQTTFGTVKGARVTKDMIQEHLGARGVSDDVRVLFQKLNDGDVLSDAQWNAFHQLIGQSRKGKWETATKEAKRKGIPIDFLPPDLKSMADAPEGADAEVFAADGKTLLGHTVKGKFVPLEKK